MDWIRIPLNIAKCDDARRNTNHRILQNYEKRKYIYIYIFPTSEKYMLSKK